MKKLKLTKVIASSLVAVSILALTPIEQVLNGNKIIMVNGIQ